MITLYTRKYCSGHGQSKLQIEIKKVLCTTAKTTQMKCTLTYEILFWVCGLPGIANTYL